MRETELRAAADIIGIGDVRVLDYKDRELALAPVEEVRSQLVGLIREVRPQVVVTFDPHAQDHIGRQPRKPPLRVAKVCRWGLSEFKGNRCPDLPL